MQATATIVIGIAFSMYLTWKMTLVSLVSVPLVMAAVVLESRVLAAGLQTVREASYRATTIATEAITNIRTVSAFCEYHTTTCCMVLICFIITNISTI